MGDSGLEILHGGVGGDVEQGARTSKHIIVFAFASLVSLTLSHFIFVHSIILIAISFISYCLYCLASFILLYIHYMLGLLVCASLILIQQELHIAPQPISRGIKRS